MENLYQSLLDSKIKQGAFVDFSKAFDTIDHSVLIKKLPFFNLTTKSIELMKSYLRIGPSFLS